MDAPRSAARARRVAALGLVVALAAACGGAGTDQPAALPSIEAGQPAGQQGADVADATTGDAGAAVPDPGASAPVNPSGGAAPSTPTSGADSASAGGATATSSPVPATRPPGEPTARATEQPSPRATEQPGPRPAPTPAASATPGPQPQYVGCAAVDAFLDRTRAARTQAAATDEDGDDYERLPRSGPTEAYRYDRDANTGGSGAAPLRWEDNELRRSANHQYGKSRSWRVDDAYRDSAAALIDRYGTDADGLVAFQDASARNRCQTTTDVYEVPGIPGAIGQAHHEPAANGSQARWYDTVAYGRDGGLNHVLAMSSVTDQPTDHAVLVRWAAEAFRQGG